MPMVLPRSVFLMIPRTATTWTRQAIRNAGIDYWETNPKHDTEVIQRVEKPLYIPNFRFTFTREPETWLRSRWFLGRWEDELSDDWDIDYPTFRAKVSDDTIRRYFARYTRQCQFVGKFENIADDLVAVLRQVGEEFDETALRETKPINESPKDGMPIGEALWKLKRDELGQLPADMIGKLPVELIPKLPKDALGRLPPDILAPLVNRLSVAALQAAGASVRGATA